uniref:G_PROTEIN_RECEP_F1_2 domain-containing protein n=1 Tax=Ascaris lumbricoides TaxID=6252 RepID=A0A0M3IBN9_ASCLU
MFLTTAHMMLQFVGILLIVTSITGNLAVLVVLLRYKSLHKSSSNVLITQLSFAGLILGIGLFIRGIQNAFDLAKNVEGYSRGACMLYGATTILAMALLQITLVMITLDRLTVLVFPLFYHRHVRGIFKECVHLSIARFLITLLVSLASFGGQFTGLAVNTDVSLCSPGSLFFLPPSNWRAFMPPVIFENTISNSNIPLFYCQSTTYLLHLLLNHLKNLFMAARNRTDDWKFVGWMIEADVVGGILVMNLATMIVYCHKTKLKCQRKENSIVLLQTSILLSYIVCWCVPTMVYLIGVILNIQAVTFGSITMALLIGSAIFVSLNPFLFLWKNAEFRTFFFRFYRLRRIISKTPTFVQVQPSIAARSTIAIQLSTPLSKP